MGLTHNVSAERVGLQTLAAGIRTPIENKLLPLTHRVCLTSLGISAFPEHCPNPFRSFSCRIVNSTAILRMLSRPKARLNRVSI